MKRELINGGNKLKAAFLKLQKEYYKNPAWNCLLFTVFTFFLLPEYISPLILFISFLVFKHQMTAAGRLAKVGTVGKIEMLLMGYMLLSVIWSPTKLDTLGCAGIWWAVFLIQVMIYNLARTKNKIRQLISVFVASAAINGFVGALQMLTYTLNINGKLPNALVLITPFYRNADAAVYGFLPFKISTNMWTSRASGFFSNPNLLATLLVVAYPFAIYLFLNTKNRKTLLRYAFEIVCITAGMASTLTRAGCFIMIIQWAVLFLFHMKRHLKRLLAAAVPTGICTALALLTRYGKITLLSSGTGIINAVPITGAEAMQSSETHFSIWRNIIDYLTTHINALLIGTGFGMEETGKILIGEYGLNKPHAHNFILEIWMELGIVGVIALFSVILCVFGKLLEINSNNKSKITLVFACAAAFGGLFVFGLSDYIFNSPKQIIIMMIVIGIVQSMSRVYDKTLIKTPKDIEAVAKQDIHNIIHQ